MRKKVALSLVLASTMAAGLCAAPVMASDETAASDGEVTEIYWFSDVSGYGPANWEDGVNSAAWDYAASEFGITFNLEQPPTDATTKLGLMIATGDIPDLISVTDSTSIQNLIEAGDVWDLQEFFETYDPDSPMINGSYPEDEKQALINMYGGWYSLSSHIETPDNREIYPPDDECWVDVVEKGSNSCIMFNKDIMDELGITEEDVSTEQGFYDACQTVKDSGLTNEAGDSVLPLVLHCNSWIGASLDSIIAWNFGASPVDADGNYQHYELSGGYKNALKFVNNCIQNGYLDVNILTLDETALKTYLENDRVFCWIGNQAQIDKTGTSWVSYGAITPENGAQGVLPINQSAGTGWIQTLVSKDCADPEGLAQFLGWILSEDGLDMNYYGIEGEDYTRDENGIITTTDSYVDKMLWAFASTSYERHTEPVPDPTSNRGVEIQLMPAFGKEETTYIYDSSLINFPDNVIEASSDLGIAEGQVESYLESQKAKIVTAASDEEFETEYNNMISTLEDYGIADIDAAYNEVYQQNCENTGEVIEDVNADLYTE